MVFSSLFFVFFFLALNLIAYHFADGIKRKNMVLLGFSLVFYSWGGPKYLLLLLSMVFASWLFALLIDQYREEGLSKIFLICDCVFMLGLLCIFKYLTFFSSITNTIFHFPKRNSSDCSANRYFFLHFPAALLRHRRISRGSGTTAQIRKSAAVCFPVPSVYRRTNRSLPAGC